MRAAASSALMMRSARLEFKTREVEMVEVAIVGSSECTNSGL
jgi:hypothetical protein